MSDWLFGALKVTSLDFKDVKMFQEFIKAGLHFACLAGELEAILGDHLDRLLVFFVLVGTLCLVFDRFVLLCY